MHNEELEDNVEQFSGNHTFEIGKLHRQHRERAAFHSFFQKTLSVTFPYVANVIFRPNIAR